VAKPSSPGRCVKSSDASPAGCVATRAASKAGAKKGGPAVRRTVPDHRVAPVHRPSWIVYQVGLPAASCTHHVAKSARAGPWWNERPHPASGGRHQAPV
jgi:hypothetical protein